MLLRSSSTPVLGSLLSSVSDSTPNNTPSHHDIITKSPANTNNLSFHHATSGSHNLSTIVSCNSSPISPSFNDCDWFSHGGFRRAQSEGNLEGLNYAPCSNNDDQFNDLYQPKKYTGRQRCSVLQTIPSFSFHNSRGHLEDDEEEEESDIENDEEQDEDLERCIAVLERDVRGGDGVIALADKVKNTSITEVVRVKDETCSVAFENENQQMYLAKGLGIDFGGGCNGNGGGGGDGGEFYSAGAGGDGGDKQGVEEYYRKMVVENPGNALFLRNYAQYLYQSKGDLQGADEYYSRAILADPDDGEILSQYAKLVWELHHDRDRAACYFERAVQGSPEDSHVQAAYANFLWDTEDDEEQDLNAMPTPLHKGTMASTSA